MTKYPNRTALYEAHNIYRDAMREFIPRCLKKVQGTTPEELIIQILNLESIDDPEAMIDIRDFPRIMRDRDCWFDAFSQLFGSREAPDVRSITGFIADGRKLWAHPQKKEDIDSEHTRTHLSVIADLLGAINEPDARNEVENIRDQLFSNEVEEHPAEIENAALNERLADTSDKLAAVEAEKTQCEKRLQDAQKRLKELKEIEAEWIAISDQLEKMKADQVDSEEKYQAILSDLKASERKKREFEEHLEATSKQLEKAEADWLVSDERFKDTLKQLTDAEAEKDELERHLEGAEKEKIELEEQLKTMPGPLETEKLEKAAYERGIQTASEELTAVKAVKAELEERLKTKSIQLEKVEEKNAKLKKNLETTEEEKTELTEQLKTMSDSNIPDSVTFQETTFTKDLDKYRVEGNDITQTFWRYWHAQRREGKQAMRDAGWSVERVEGNWEITISPEDFQVWIENEGLTTQPTSPLHERTEQPTGKEMEQPTLELLADRREHPRIEIINLLTEHFSLTQNQREKLSRSGRAEVYLRNKGLIERTRTGYYRITTRGLKVLRQNSYRGESSKIDGLSETSSSYTTLTPAERTELPRGKKMEQPVLALLSDGKEHRRKKIIYLLAQLFSLTDDEREYLSKTGQVEKHLMNEGLIERTRIGYYRITTHGLETLRRNPHDTDF